MVCRLWRYGIVLAAVPLLASCESATPGPASPPTPSQGAPPISVEVNQSRDQYGKQAILIQLTNNTGGSVTVSSAVLRSSLFHGDITWKPADGTLDLPPKQPKSLPANLPGAACSGSSSLPVTATVQYVGAGQATQETTEASDPFNVLRRNSDELCLAAEAGAVATLALAPELDVDPGGSTAVVRLVITPTGTASNPLTIRSIDGTTLLAEPPTDPWPRDITVTDNQVVPLRIRPARCDPHAVAEDKVGTLLPLHVSVGSRDGVLKVAAPAELRGRIYDFVTSACSGG